MNEAQKRWWEQAKSDHQAFMCLRTAGVHECHLLHYLQMATEKISKAYLWRSGTAPPKSHVGLMSFLKALLSRGKGDLTRIAKTFGFKTRQGLDAWVNQIADIAHSLQNLAPDIAKDGPNPEYPWPHAMPIQSPASYSFALWAKLRDHGKGRTFQKFVKHAIERFDQYA